jgi:hypothetical protein
MKSDSSHPSVCYVAQRIPSPGKTRPRACFFIIGLVGWGGEIVFMRPINLGGCGVMPHAQVLLCNIQSSDDFDVAPESGPPSPLPFPNS